MSYSLSYMDCSPQALLSTGFSQQEYWSGLPFPPPGDLPDPGIKTTLPAPPAVQMDFLPPSHQGSSFPSLSEVAQSYPTICDAMDCSLLPSSFVHGIFQARVPRSGLPFPSPGDLPDPGIKPGSPALQADALPSEPPGKLAK